jgi:hypothetical protein
MIKLCLFNSHYNPTWCPSIGVITGAGELRSGNIGIPNDEPPPVNGDKESSVFVVRLWGEISPYPERADGVSPPPSGPNGGLLLKVVRDWDGVAFGESGILPL